MPLKRKLDSFPISNRKVSNKLVESRQVGELRSHRENVFRLLCCDDQRPAACDIEADRLFDEHVQPLPQRLETIRHMVARAAGDDRSDRMRLDGEGFSEA